MKTDNQTNVQDERSHNIYTKLILLTEVFVLKMYVEHIAHL